MALASSKHNQVLLLGNAHLMPQDALENAEIYNSCIVMENEGFSRPFIDDILPKTDYAVILFRDKTSFRRLTQLRLPIGFQQAANTWILQRTY